MLNIKKNGHNFSFNRMPTYEVASCIKCDNEKSTRENTSKTSFLDLEPPWIEKEKSTTVAIMGKVTYAFTLVRGVVSICLKPRTAKPQGQNLTIPKGLPS